MYAAINAMLRQPVLLLQFARSSLRCAVTTWQPYVARSGAGNERSRDRRPVRLATTVVPMPDDCATDAACGLVGNPTSQAMRPPCLLRQRYCVRLCLCRVRLPSLVLHEQGGKLADIRGPVQHAADVGNVCLDDFRGGWLELGGDW